MKKIIIFLIWVALSSASIAQNKTLKAPNGLTVGRTPSGSLVVPIDSITDRSNDEILFWKDGQQLNPNLLQGFKIGTTTITPSAAQVNFLVDVEDSIQKQFNTKVSKDSILNAYTYFYSKSQVDSLIPFTTPVQNNASILHNGTGGATTIFSDTIPANSVTTTGQFDILAIFSFSGTASKVIQVKFGTSAVIQVSPTTQVSGAYMQTIVNVNSLSSQIAWNLGAGLGNSSSAAQTFSLDETQDIPVTVVCNVPVGETATLLFLRVRAIKR